MSLSPPTEDSGFVPPILNSLYTRRPAGHPDSIAVAGGAYVKSPIITSYDGLITIIRGCDIPLALELQESGLNL